MNILKHSAVIGAMTLVSRILGLVRDIIIAKIFGVSAVLDAFLVAFKIPNFLRRLFAEGSFSQAVMPILAKSKADNNEQEVINHITGRLFVILFVITAIVVILSPLVVILFAPSYYFDDSPSFELTSELLKITFPYLLFISLTAFFGSILNNNKRFALAAFTPALLNISLILSALYFTEYFETPIYALAIGVFIGGVLQLGLQIPFLIRIGKLPKPAFKSHPVFSDVYKRMLPALFSTSITQINLLVDTIIATTLIAGSVSWLYYANRLLELPIALIGVALGIVGIANLSRLFIHEQHAQFKAALTQSIHYALLFGLPASVGLVYLSEPLIITLFHYGNFSLADSTNSAGALAIYGMASVLFILIKVLTPAFLAVGDTKTPVKVGFIALFVNIVLNIALSHYYEFLGIAMATVVYACVNVLGLIIMLIRTGIYQFNTSLLLPLLKITCATLAMLIALILSSKYLISGEYANAALSKRIGMLSVELVIALLAYFGGLFILRQRIKLV